MAPHVKHYFDRLRRYDRMLPRHLPEKERPVHDWYSARLREIEAEAREKFGDTSPTESAVAAELEADARDNGEGVVGE